MLSVLLWILCGIGILCIMVFCGKRKVTLPESDREVMISEAVCNIAALTLVLTQLLFPLYGYSILPLGSSYPGRMEPAGQVLAGIFKMFNVSCYFPFAQLVGNSVYFYVMLTAVFCFFAGMFIYKNGLKIKYKRFLSIPLLVLAVTLIRSFIRIADRKSGVRDFPKYYSLLLLECIERYLMTAFVMIAVLYGIYLLLKKLMHNEIIPLILIFILSFFAPCVRVVYDGLHISEPVIGNLYFGPDIPLFPAGMIVMKYKDKILPKNRKGALIHVCSWLFAGVAALCALFGIQYLLSKLTGVPFSAAQSCFDDEIYRENMRVLERIYKTACVPWLFAGFALSMMILALTLLIRTGNPVTKFFREHGYLITVFLFSRHIFFEISGHDMSFWTGILKMPENLFITVPFIYAGLSVVLAYLIKRFILDKLKTKSSV